MRRKKKEDRPEDLETDELEQPVFDEKGVSRAKLDDEEKAGQPIGGAGVARGNPDEMDDVGEETISLSGDHSYSLDAATDTEYPTLSEGSEMVMDEIDQYTDDDEILQDFAERQQLNTGRDELIERLVEHHSKTPALSGGDIDARWEDADVSGEESVGSTVVTPDQDVVDELGDAFGIDYEADEPLATADKLDARDRNRWELSPASMESDPDADEDDLAAILEDDLDEDLDALDEEDEEDEDELEDLEDDLEDEFPAEIEDELDGDLEDLEEDEEFDEDDEGYDLEDIDDDLDEDLDEFLDEDFDEDDDDY
jgi:hypothetical protein